MFRPSVFAGLLASLAALQVLAWRGWGPPPGQSWLSVFVLFGAASLAVTYVVDTHRARARVFVIGILAGAMAGVAWLLWQGAVAPRTAARGGLALAALAGLAGYAWDIADSPDTAARRRRLAALRDAALVPLAVAHVPFFLWMTTGINPVFDARVFGIEASLGVNLSALAHETFAALPMVGYAAMACYLALPVGLAATVRLQPTGDLQDRVFAAALAAGVVGFALYAVSPVVGMFPAFPAGTPAPGGVDAAPIIVTAEVPRNGMPSLHTVWALLIALHAQRLAPVWRAGLTVFAALNLWAAAGAVGHWALDLIVAVPIAGMVHLAVTPGVRRVRAGWMLACAAVTLTWVAALRVGAAPTGDTPALVTWTAVLLTLAVPVAGLQQTGSFSASGRR